MPIALVEAKEEIFLPENQHDEAVGSRFLKEYKNFFAAYPGLRLAIGEEAMTRLDSAHLHMQKFWIPATRQARPQGQAIDALQQAYQVFKETLQATFTNSRGTLQIGFRPARPEYGPLSAEKFHNIFPANFQDYYASVVAEISQEVLMDHAREVALAVLLEEVTPDRIITKHKDLVREAMQNLIEEADGACEEDDDFDDDMFVALSLAMNEPNSLLGIPDEVIQKCRNILSDVATNLRQWDDEVGQICRRRSVEELTFGTSRQNIRAL